MMDMELCVEPKKNRFLINKLPRIQTYGTLCMASSILLNNWKTSLYLFIISAFFFDDIHQAKLHQQ